MQDILQNAANCTDICKYVKQKTGWTWSFFESVQWATVEASFHDLTLLNKVRVLKFQHNWLQTGARTHKFNPKESAQCLICTTAVEDWVHLFQCSHDLACKSQTHMFAKLWSYLMKQKTNRLIQNVNIYKLQQWCGHGTAPPRVPAE
eukprot:9844879-Ditylum_brightwellii.AAC.1